MPRPTALQLHTAVREVLEHYAVLSTSLLVEEMITRGLCARSRAYAAIATLVREGRLATSPLVPGRGRASPVLVALRKARRSHHTRPVVTRPALTELRQQFRMALTLRAREREGWALVPLAQTPAVATTWLSRVVGRQLGGNDIVVAQIRRTAPHVTPFPLLQHPTSGRLRLVIHIGGSLSLASQLERTPSVLRHAQELDIELVLMRGVLTQRAVAALRAWPKSGGPVLRCFTRATPPGFPPPRGTAAGATPFLVLKWTRPKPRRRRKQ
jgi:hypothetical protein